MWAVTVCLYVCMHVFVCLCVFVYGAGSMCTAGWPGKTCLSVCGTSLAFLSPEGPKLCPEAGRLGGGTSTQGGPQAVCVHYGYRDGTWPAGGQTFSPYLLWSSAAPLFGCTGGKPWKCAWKPKKSQLEPITSVLCYCLTCELVFVTNALCLCEHIFKCLCLHIYTCSEILHLEGGRVLLWLFLDTA